MKCIHLISAAFAALVGVAVMSAPAFAGPTYTFSVSTGAQPSNVGTITLQQGDTVPPPPAVPAACANPANCVTIDLTFISGIYGIMNSGAKIPFGFQLNSTALAETLAIAWIDPTGGSYTNSQNNSGTFSLNRTTGSQAGFGDFNTWISNSAGNGSSDAYYGELKFVLECTANCGTGLDTNDFIVNGNSPGVYFTADVTNGSNTGSQAWEVRKKVPEPATILLCGSALAAFGLGRRRRRSKID